MSETGMMVSIVCNTYNHEKYIASALESFVAQRTDFPFEVLVHDDASTDGTADVIRQYAEKYPQLIKPVYQTENQYSQGVDYNGRYQLSRAKGKYIALCEGDDYWIDPEKLSKQVAALESHPELDICAHAGYASRNGEYVRMIAPAQEDAVFTVEQVIAGGGGYVVTASLMYRKAMLERKYAFQDVIRLDYTLQIRGSLRGGMLYLKDCMSVYRLATESSWTVQMSAAPQRRIRHTERVNEMLRTLDADTQGRYAPVIRQMIAKNQCSNLQRQGRYTELLKPGNRLLREQLSRKRRMKLPLLALREQWRRLTGNRNGDEGRGKENK